MATISGFQSNTTIHAAFWIYKPDPTVDPISKEQIIEVNSLQKVEANAAVILTNISNVAITSNVLTLTVGNASNLRTSQQIIISGLTSATFLNGQVVTINRTLGNTFTANFINPDYPSTADTGTVTDTTNRTAYLYYPQTDVSTSQAPLKLDGAVAARFIYDMEALFA
jgi:hypothetical protein